MKPKLIARIKGGDRYFDPQREVKLILEDANDESAALSFKWECFDIDTAQRCTNSTG